MTTPTKAGRQAPAVKYHLDLPVERRRHTERDEFTIVALWLAGFSASSISRTYGFRRSQILGIVHRSGFEMRSKMSDRQRQAELDFLRECRIDDQTCSRIDGGALINFTWTILPITDGRKRRPARKASES